MHRDRNNNEKKGKKKKQNMKKSGTLMSCGLYLCAGYVFVFVLLAQLIYTYVPAMQWHTYVDAAYNILLHLFIYGVRNIFSFSSSSSSPCSFNNNLYYLLRRDYDIDEINITN